MSCFTSLYTLFPLPEIHRLSFLPGQFLPVLPDPDQMPHPRETFLNASRQIHL